MCSGTTAVLTQRRALRKDQTRTNKKKGKAILFTKVSGTKKKKKKAAELEDGRKTVLGMAPTKSLPSLD